MKNKLELRMHELQEYFSSIEDFRYRILLLIINFVQKYKLIKNAFKIY